ncbi:MAG: single-stranded-DNA-specific exonuclease RecJ [Candidatus Tectomicrobia bacterium]|uniref:Single-stranded-DNA-specific exonuclease RecJ n=1 Tax=Tectimicrobiota bacterium TaxID=2528274 RepID=A0A932HW86_UNCTE|nr:single-stranded-DNA-specific exonuclease RecJ [Candidatus Tectomicrobia bacterium]
MTPQAAGPRPLARGAAAQSWRVRPADEDEVRRLAAGLDAPPLLARLLSLRGIRSPEDARLFLQAPLTGLHDPFEMLGMDAAAAHLAGEVERGGPVGVYGDYDVDGITSTALLVRFFRSLGIEAPYHVPRRLEEGYGLHLAGLLRLKEAGCRTVVTVDCGITAAEVAAEAKAQGLRLIVTDHHRPPERLPEALAVLNPRRPGCPYPFKGLTGAGIAFKLAAAVRRLLRDKGFARSLPNLKQHLDLVALGTVADVAPLLGENHILVRAGLGALSAPPGLPDRRKAGVRALQAAADLKADEINAGHVGFVLGPRLNAAGRVGDPRAAVELLLTDDLAEAHAVAVLLDDWNHQRQELQQEALEEAEVLLAAAGEAGLGGAIVLASERWHSGVIGIVASKLAEAYRLPAALIRLDGEGGRGSVRGVEGFHVYRALEGCADCLVQFGGHKEAAGLAIRRGMVDAFRARFQEASRLALGPERGEEVLWLDASVGFSDLDLGLIERLEEMAPFGPGNPRPLLGAAGVEVVGVPGFAGRDREHLKLALRHQGRTMEAIGFGMGPLAREGGLPPGKIDIACCPCVNRWRGSTKLQLELKAIRPAGG